MGLHPDEAKGNKVASLVLSVFVRVLSVLAVLIRVAVHVCTCMGVLQKCVCMYVPTENTWLISLPDWEWKHRAAAALPQNLTNSNKLGTTLSPP